MSPSQLEPYRVPAALLLILVAGILFWPRGGTAPAAGNPSPTPGVVAGEPGGEVVAVTPSPAPATPVPTATPAATPTPAATEPPPPPETGFTAEVLACRSISGSTCNGQLGTLPANAASFTALVLFQDATVGDQLNAVLDGPSGTIGGSAYALQGSGDGHFWAEFRVDGLPGGDYVVTALRNGQPVASTGFRMAGS
jgi:hypothetical protein